MIENCFDEKLLSEKTVVITGAGRGIGLEITKLIVACGAKVIAHSGREGTAKYLSNLSDSVFEADFTDTNSVDEFIEFVKNESSVIDVLINNAGTMFGRFPADEITNEQYQKLVSLNQTSVVQITSALIPQLKLSKNGAIINTVSISALTGGSPGSSIYSSTKAFVSTYTKALARELAPNSIRANAISPGTISVSYTHLTLPTICSV